MPKPRKKPPAHKVILARLIHHKDQLLTEPLIAAQQMTAERLDELCMLLEIMAIPEHDKKDFALSLRRLQKDCESARQKTRVGTTKKMLFEHFSTCLEYVLRLIETDAS